MGMLESGDKARRSKSAAAAEASRHKDDIAVKREQIEATRELRRETIKLKAQVDEIANRTRIGNLEAVLMEGERKAIDDLRNSQPYMLATEAEQKRAEDEIRRTYAAKRSQYQIDAPEAPGEAAASGGIKSPKTREEYDALPSGTVFRDPKGVERRKP